MDETEQDEYSPEDWLGTSITSADIEEKLRAKHPGLKEIWDQYQTMLKLVKLAPNPAEQSAADMLAMIRARAASGIWHGVQDDEE